MDDPKYDYFVVWTYRIAGTTATMFGCRDVSLDGPLDEPECRKKLAAELALEFPNLVLVNWKRSQ